MHEIPECLNRRYKALDDLVNELGSASDVDISHDESGASCNDPGVKLMCDFWNILKENPDCNLMKAVQNRLDVSPRRSMFQPQRVSCFMAAHNCSKKNEDTNKSDSGAKPIGACCHRGADPKVKAKCCASKSVSSSQGSSDVLPLSKVLCNLKEAASFERKCQGMVNDLMAAQKELQDQIQHLEHREKEGVQLLKQADCMWSCMEDAYKKKILESQERQQELIKQLKEAEANTNKWRKNKKDLEFQMENVNMCHQEISEKLQQKQNDLKCMNRDIDDYKKRITNNKKELDAAKKAMGTKKHASDDKIKKISGDISRLEARIRVENAHKAEKETEGNQYIKAARADLLNLSKILLQKRIENEEIQTEKETLIDELEILSQTYDQCKDRCKSKKQAIDDEIKKIDKEITNFKSKCIRCHQCTDTIDIRKYCTDCPRCLEERECLYKEDHCSPDHTMDCVCLSVKQKFLDNIFENMYTVLEKQIKTGPGRCVAETVLNCLKRSRNGKLDQQTKQILQDFILTTVKKNLNLTIVGGAVKTRCELDSDTYKQLMLCLNKVKAVKPPKADKQTAAKKPPCSRWGGESECNCPKGPKACVCTKKAPPPPSDPSPCPPPDKEDKGEEKTCPYKESAACGPDCAMHAVPSAVGTDVAAWRPDPCQGPTCTFKNMRAAQCVLGPEALNTMFDSRSFVTAVPHVPNTALTEVQKPCKCGSSPMKLCRCKDIRGKPREKVIEEVMGNYFEVTPIQKVSTTKEECVSDVKIRRPNKDIHINTLLQKYVVPNIYSKRDNSTYNYTAVKNNKELLKNNVYTSESDKKDKVVKSYGHSLKSYIYYVKCITAVLQKPTILYSKLRPDVIPTKSEKVRKPIANIADTVNDEHTTFKPSNLPLFRQISSIAKKIITSVITGEREFKKDSSKQWITVESLLNKIQNKTKMEVEDIDVIINEVRLNTQCLNNNEIIKTQEISVSTKTKINTIYRNTHYGHTKQMRIGTRTQCDDKICGMRRSNLYLEESLSPIANIQSVENNLPINGEDFTRIISKIKNDQFNNTETVTVDNKIKQDLIKEQFQPLLCTKAIQNETNLFPSNSTDILKSNASKPSTSSKTEIDEKIIDLIENIIKEDPNSFVSLKKTSSGHLALGFNSISNNDEQSIVVKRSPSGNMIIEIEKSSLNNLASEKCNNKDCREKTEQKKNISFDDPKECKADCSITKKLKNKNDDSISKSNQQIVIQESLKNMYENSHRHVDVRFKRQNNELINIEGTIIQIKPKIMAIHVKKANIVSDQYAEFPLTVQCSESGIVNMRLANYDSSNAVATRTTSNGFLININETNKQQLKPFELNREKPEDMFKIKIKGLDKDLKEPPALIRRTPSGNYDVVLEKEFEKYFTDTIQHLIVNDTESPFDLTKTSSSVILDFDKDHNNRSRSQKALLMKSNSGLLKIIISDQNQNKKEKLCNNNALSTVGSKISVKTLCKLLKKLPSNSKLHKNIVKKNNENKTKSNSDSNLYETSKIKLHSNESLLEKSATTLKETSSGQYAVVLDKESRKSFINNLLSHLNKSSKGVIPIKRTDSGDMIISCDKNLNIGECGSLKITNSGNIYLILDENLVNTMVHNAAESNSLVSNKTNVSKIKQPQNKAISTNCNAHPDDSLCDASKCVCECLSKNNDISINSNSVNIQNARVRFCGKSKCSGFHDKQNISDNNNLPHIVIRPHESRPGSDKLNKFQESYYCELESVCPYHKGRYEAVSNELLEISGPCNKGLGKPLSKVKTYTKIKEFIPKKSVNQEWNSFDYLPHQLPCFLRNITS